MSQLPDHGPHSNVSQVNMLKQQYKDAIQGRKEAQNSSNELLLELNSYLSQRKKSVDLIQDPAQRETFKQLHKLNVWLLRSNIHMGNTDDVDKMWLTQIVDFKGDVVFMDKQSKQNKSPEFNELANFIYDMQVDWMEQYYVKFEEANQSRDKQKKLFEHK